MYDKFHNNEEWSWAQEGSIINANFKNFIEAGFVLRVTKLHLPCWWQKWKYEYKNIFEESMQK